MRKQFVGAVALTGAMFAPAVMGWAGPASAAPVAPAPQAPTARVIMPDVRNMVLQRAVGSVLDAAGPVELDLRMIDRKNGQQVINQTNWAVCAQSPAAGRVVSQTTNRVILYVKRFNQTGCS